MDNLKLWFLTTRHNRFSEEEKLQLRYAITQEIDLAILRQICNFGSLICNPFHFRVDYKRKFCIGICRNLVVVVGLIS